MVIILFSLLILNLRRCYMVKILNAVYFILAWSVFIFPAKAITIDSEKTERVETDTVVVFKFVPGTKMFYSAHSENEQNIVLLSELIENNRLLIEQGLVVICVNGYCSSFSDAASNLQVAKNRSNQVKSYFITHLDMEEGYYKTRNSVHPHEGQMDVVRVYRKQLTESRSSVADSILLVVDEKQDSVHTVAEEHKMPEEQPAIEQQQKIDIELASPSVEEKMFSRFAIKTNLLYDAILMPSLEVEYRINDKWSVNLEGSIAWWSNNKKHKYYQIAMVSPEVRYWFKTKEPWHGHYAGFYLGGGLYDLENGGRGYQGEFYVASGLSYGYMFPLNKHLSMEVGVGIGYMMTEYKKYLPSDGCYVYQKTERSHYFGPTKLKLSLVWQLGGKTKKGGSK